MEFVESFIKGIFVLTPRKFEDERGCFMESFNQQTFNDIVGSNITFAQDNESVSFKNVLRGLHFQNPPSAQGKLVRVANGSVFDVAVDIRKNSPTYGKWHGEMLSAQNRKQLWIPEGFAHGFVALEDDTKFLYKCTSYYSPQSEQTLLWNDSTLAIDWKIEHPIISLKDKNGKSFKEFLSPF